MLSGIHQSRTQGASVVFSEHREYRPGDDIRLLDWRAYAKSDRHTIKRFEQETALRATLLLDSSGSMAWDGLPGGREGRAKDLHAATVLGGLAFALQRQGDAIGSWSFTVSLGDGTPPRTRGRGSFGELLALLARPAHPERKTDIGRALKEVVPLSGRRGLVAIASDLLDFEDDALAPLAELRTRGHEIVVFHVVHPDELALPPLGGARIEGLEDEDEPIEVDLGAVADAYAREMSAHIERVRRQCLAFGARHVLTRTDEPPADALERAFRRRR